LGREYLWVMEISVKEEDMGRQRSRNLSWTDF